MSKHALKTLAACVLIGGLGASLAPADQNFPLVRNGDFRLQQGNRLVMRQSWLAGHTMTFEKAEGPDGLPAVLMDRPNGAIYQDLELVPGHHVLSVEVNVSPNGKAKVQAGEVFKEHGETNGWQRVSVKFAYHGEPVRITLDNPAPAAGAVRFRDVRVDVERLNSSTVLVADGEPIGRIVLAPDAEPAEQYAAWELQHSIWRMTGHAPGLAGRDEVFPGRTVFVGRAAKGPAVDKLKQLKDESYVVAADDSSVILAGKTPRGTLYATYDFLKTQGCGWYMPGARGEVIPKRDALAIRDGSRVETPDWDVRGILVHPGNYYHNGSYVIVVGDDYFDWAVRNRINAMWQGTSYTIDLGAHRGYSHTQRLNHSWQSFYPKDGPAEWAPLVKGKRTRYYPGGRPNMLCTSNQDYRDAVVEGVLEYFRENPRAAAYSVSADDEPAFWCECRECRAQDADRGRKKWECDTTGRLVGRPHMPMTDRAIHFVNEVAERVTRVYPDKLIEMYAYGSTQWPPARFKVHPSVLMKICYFGQRPSRSLSDMTFWAAASTAKGKRGLDHWVKAGVKHFGLYDYGSFQNPDCPVFWFYHITDSLKVFHEKWGFRHYLGETDNTFGPSMMAYNLRARALWDRNIDYRREIEDICREFYGPAARDMFDYYMLMHDALLEWEPKKTGPSPEPDEEPDQPSLPGTKRGSYWLGLGLEYDISIMAEGQKILDRAAAKAGGDSMLETRISVAQFGHSLFTLYVADESPWAAPETPEMIAAAKAARERVMSLWGKHGNLVLRSTREYLAHFRPKPLIEQTLAELPLVWAFRKDPDNVGLDEKWYRAETQSGDHWSEIRTDSAWTNQGHAYHGAAWYRIDFTSPAECREPLGKALSEGRAALLFEAVDGTVDVFLDGKKIGEQKRPGDLTEKEPFVIDLPADLDPAARHRLVVRVEKKSRAAGIWKPVSVVIVDKL